MTSGSVISSVPQISMCKTSEIDRDGRVAGKICKANPVMGNNLCWILTLKCLRTWMHAVIEILKETVDQLQWKNYDNFSRTSQHCTRSDTGA